MKLLTLSILVAFLLIANVSIGQGLEGIWKGTSLCQVKPSPCHDETVVYHIAKNEGNSYQIIANKIINGKEDYMGTLIYTYDPKQHILISIDSVRQAKWEFKVTDKTMHGTLIYKGQLFRIIDLKKEGLDLK